MGLLGKGIDLIPKRYQLAIIVVIIAIGGAWYLSGEYNKNKAEVAIKQQAIDSLQRVIVEKQKAHDELNSKYNQLEQDYGQAIARFEQIQVDMINIKKHYDEQLSVFKKKEGRFNELLQKRNSRVVGLANNKLDQLRQQFETSASRNGLREDES